MISWVTIGVGALGALIGGTIVTLFRPVLQPVASYLNKWLWTALGRFNPPKPDAYTLIDTKYKPGSGIREFPNETWKSSYKIVDFHLQNTSNQPIVNLRAYLSFDGIVIGSSVMDSSYTGVDVAPIVDGGFRTHQESETIADSGSHGAMNVFINRLPSRRSIRVKFLINTDTSKTTSIVHPEKEDSRVNYHWSFHDVTYVDTKIIKKQKSER